jgi:hypothetical protein
MPTISARLLPQQVTRLLTVPAAALPDIPYFLTSITGPGNVTAAAEDAQKRLGSSEKE